MAGLQGRVFGGYQLTEQLSSAGIAEVYKGLPGKPGGREVVVKVIHPEFARMPGFLPNFREIVQATGKLASHPHILPLLASGEESGYLYLVTPYVAAGTLKDWIGRGGRMGPGDVGPFFRQLCDALTYAHSLGVVHGDVKPSNVFLFEGRHVLLGDFGLLFDVAHLDMDHAGSGAEVVEYLAPEVMQGPPTQQCDVYSVGAVLFAAITGQPPFRGTRPSDIFGAHARQPVPSLAQAHPGLSPVMQALDPVIQRAMAKQPAQRFPSAAGIGQAVEAILRQAAGAQQSQPKLAAMQAFARSPGAGQPFSPAAPLPGVPDGFTPLAPGQLGFGALMAGGALGGAAANALGAGLGVSSSIRPLGPQFPPLPASAMVDESMEQGRVTVRAPEPNDPLAPQPQDGGIPLLPTMHMAASGADAGSLTAEATMRVAAPEPGGASEAAGPATDDGAPRGRGARGIFSLARKRSGLGKRFGQGTPSMPPAMGAAGGDEGAAAPALPTVNGPQAPQAQGFSVAGGTDPSRAAAGWGASAPDAFSRSVAGAPWDASADDAFSQELPVADWGAGLSGEQSGVFELGNEPPSAPAWGGSGPVSVAGFEAVPRDFSATELGLPRLTHGAAGAPSAWQEILSGPLPVVRPQGRDDAGADYGQVEIDSPSPQATWGSGQDRGAERGWGEESGEWAASNVGADAWSGDSAPMPAQRAMSRDPWAAVEAPMGPIRVPNAPPSGNRPAPEDDIELDFEEPRGRRRRAATFRRRPRWIRPVLTLLLLLTLVDAAGLVVLRPDLCPNATCRAIGTRARSYLPFLNTPAPQPQSDLSVDPASAKVSVVTEKTATAQLKVTNNSTAIITWTATAALPWVTLTPANGALPAQSGAMLIATVNAKGIKPGAYTTTVTFSYGRQTLVVPVSIDVTAT